MHMIIKRYLYYQGSITFQNLLELAIDSVQVGKPPSNQCTHPQIIPYVFLLFLLSNQLNINDEEPGLNNCLL